MTPFRSFSRLNINHRVADYRVFEIYRYNPDKDTKPHMERYAVDVST